MEMKENRFYKIIRKNELIKKQNEKKRVAGRAEEIN